MADRFVERAEVLTELIEAFVLPVGRVEQGEVVRNEIQNLKKLRRPLESCLYGFFQFVNAQHIPVVLGCHQDVDHKGNPSVRKELLIALKKVPIRRLFRSYLDLFPRPCPIRSEITDVVRHRR